MKEKRKEERQTEKKDRSPELRIFFSCNAINKAIKRSSLTQCVRLKSIKDRWIFADLSMKRRHCFGKVDLQNELYNSFLAHAHTIFTSGINISMAISVIIQTISQ